MSKKIGENKNGFIFIPPALKFKGEKKYHRGWHESWSKQSDQILKGFESVWSPAFEERYKKRYQDYRAEKHSDEIFV